MVTYSENPICTFLNTLDPYLGWSFQRGWKHPRERLAKENSVRHSRRSVIKWSSFNDERKAQMLSHVVYISVFFLPSPHNKYLRSVVFCLMQYYSKWRTGKRRGYFVASAPVVTSPSDDVNEDGGDCVDFTHSTNFLLYKKLEAQFSSRIFRLME